MTPQHSRQRAGRTSEDVITFASSGGRRTMFFLVFVLLLCGMLYGLEIDRDLTGTRLVGTIVYFSLLLSLLGVAGWQKRVDFDRKQRMVRTDHTMFKVPLRNPVQVSIDDHAEVILQSVVLVKGRPERDDKSNLLSGFLTARTHLFRLFIQNGDERIRVEETTSRDELLEMGKGLSEFLGLPFVETEL